MEKNGIGNVAANVEMNVKFLVVHYVQAALLLVVVNAVVEEN